MELPGLAEGLRAALMVAAYPVGAVFLAANWHLPGMRLVALGAALNLLAISVNGGVMPASPSALAGAGLGADEPGVPETPRPGRAPAGVPRRRLPPSCLLAAQQRLQRRGHPDRPWDRVGTAPHLPVNAWPHPGPTNTPKRRSPSRLAKAKRHVLTAQASSGAPGLRTGPQRVRLVVSDPSFDSFQRGLLPPPDQPSGWPGRWRCRSARCRPDKRQGADRYRPAGAASSQ